MKTTGAAAVAATILCTLCPLAYATDPAPVPPWPRTGPYMGLDMGAWRADASTYFNEAASIAASLGVPFSGSPTATGFTASPYVGFQFFKYAALEVGYVQGTSAITTIYVGGIPVNLSPSFKGVDFSAIGTLPLKRNAGLYARVGVIKAWDKVDVYLPDDLLISASATANGSKGVYGAGAFAGNGEIVVRLEYTRSNDVAGVKLDRFVLGVVIPIW